jgi:adenosylcobinamide-GDP ribazoletransferase
MTPTFDVARRLAEVKACLGLLTRIPLPNIGDGDDGDANSDLAQASWAFPVIGALIGTIGALVFALASTAGLPPWVAALLAVGATALASGGLHEDGLADVADGFGGAFAREDKLAIMRDSHIGTYGTLALILSVALRAAALAAIAEPLAAGAALIAAHAGARACLPAVMRGVPLARADGLAAEAGIPETATVATALGLAALIALVMLGVGSAVLAVIAAAAAAAAMTAVARWQIGGYSGDVLGAVQQCAEIAILAAAAAA